MTYNATYEEQATLEKILCCFPLPSLHKNVTQYKTPYLPEYSRRTLPTTLRTEIDWCELYTGAYYTIAVLEMVGRVRTIQLAFQLGWLVVINFFFFRFTQNSFSVDFESFTPAAQLFWVLHI